MKGFVLNRANVDAEAVGIQPGMEFGRESERIVEWTTVDELVRIYENSEPGDQLVYTVEAIFRSAVQRSMWRLKAVVDQLPGPW